MRAALADGRFTADVVDVIREDSDLREPAYRLVKEGPDRGPSRALHAQAAAYSSPMHPEVTSDRPGTCPKCGDCGSQSGRGVEVKITPREKGEIGFTCGMNMFHGVIDVQ